MKKVKLIFICTGNSCRSQMAEGLLRNAAGNLFEVCSAGTHPSIVHPKAIKVMAESGIDIAGHTSDPITKYIGKGIDIVITVCDSANTTCPTFPGKVQRFHWSIEDPFDGWSDSGNLTPYRNTRDILSEKINAFLKEWQNE